MAGKAILRKVKRDLDLVRHILLFVESNSGPTTFLTVQIEGYSQDVVNYHVFLLMEAKFILGTEPPLKHAMVVVTGLTSKGHDYLDAIRSDKVWEHTKKLIEPLGSVAMGTLKQLAMDVAVKFARGE